MFHKINEILFIYSCWFDWLTNPFTLGVPLKSIVCYSHTFENNLRMKQNLPKYLMESCCLASNYNFSFNYFPKKCPYLKNTIKIVRPVLAALSVNGLKHVMEDNLGIGIFNIFMIARIQY